MAFSLLMSYRCCVFGLNYLDKTTLSYASIMGIKNDINLEGNEYQWLGSIFYIGWLAWEVSFAFSFVSRHFKLSDKPSVFLM